MRPNFCTLSPDTLHRFDWSKACKEHDDIYRDRRGPAIAIRSRADQLLRRRMLQEVRKRHDRSFFEHMVGYTIAWFYWIAVRMFGWMWWRT
ncbi:hypothetical protein A2635_00175 [Candidatus Peribacteria bacterium RIFCSPHIGHO2_01_FULL_51_9]|nr:MAG: hypothetical protein A2635_00175 [Candidatus Peribacteria bacterium RIFCSPHIGHO2_01_FULL_51_9]